MYPDANNAGTFSFTVVSELVVSNSFPGNVNAFTAFFAVAKTFLALVVLRHPSQARQCSTFRECPGTRLQLCSLARPCRTRCLLIVKVLFACNESPRFVLWTNLEEKTNQRFCPISNAPLSNRRPREARVRLARSSRTASGG